MDNIFLAVLGAVLAALVVMSAYFSASETAYSTMNVIRVKNLANDGNKRAQKAVECHEGYERLLTTILVGNNIVNIAASSICAMMFTEMFGLVGVAYATIFMATAILVCGEITPKTLAKRNAERYALRFAGSLRIAETVLAPIAFVFMKLTGAISKGAKNDSAESPSITEDELVVMIDEIGAEGTLEKRESELIKSAIHFDDTKVSEILTPRVDIVAVDIKTDVESMKRTFLESKFSRIPVYDGTIDRIVGAITSKDFFFGYVNDARFELKDIVMPVKFVPENANIATLLGDLQKAGAQLAIVLDNFGGTVGIVTMEDIIEELVGDIWDENDEVKYPVTKEDDGSYTVLGEANIFDAMAQIGLTFDPDGFHTHSVSGFIHHKLERIPKVGDIIEIDNATIIVKSMKSRRIREAKIIPDPEREKTEETSVDVEDVTEN
ncbi:MAG: hemolysin family protein [Candidatus Methanoplasma sp.]|jgi:CBS domain containing-hemolysin-like protein|nr:hemolysin family protein [Candidatus Methanoplasma sp.]